MFSRLALRSGGLGTLIRQTKNPVVLVATRNSSTENWDKANAIYYGPDRDTENFPVRKMPESAPPVRLGFLPESWFKFYEEKAGVSGPYVLGTGALLTAFSKEFWVIDHGFSEVLGFWIMFVIFAKKLGPPIAKYLDTRQEEYMNATWHKPIKTAKSEAEQTMKQIDTVLWQEEGQKYVFDAKKENIDLQLEAQYRERLHDAYKAVKSRLDYQLERQNTRIRFEQEHMVNWIVENVVKGITPQQEKDAIAKCIQDLKRLAASV